MNKNFIRIIPRLDIKNGQLIKGINLEGLRVLGDPNNFSKKYYETGADEICYVDNVATLYGTINLLKFVKQTSKDVYIPLTVGGGIRSIKNIEEMLKNGADKVGLNSAGIIRPKFIREASRNFGSSTITVMIETVKYENKYKIVYSNGRDLVNKNPVDWAKQVEDLGAGEITLTSVNHEGIKEGFDLEITEKISKAVKIPVLAHGGAGNYQNVFDVIKNSNISGVIISSMFHYSNCFDFNFKKKEKKELGNFDFINNKKNKLKKIYSIDGLKKFLKMKKVDVRL